MARRVRSTPPEMRPGSTTPLLLALTATLSLAGCSALPEDVDGPEPVGELTDAVFAGSVDAARKQTCATASVKGLSEQILAEMQCLEPDAFVKVPARPNLSIGSGIFPFLDADAKDRLLAALDAKPGTTLTINSMFRTVAQQYLVYRWYQSGTCGIGLAAKPGSSNHETGLAIDIAESATWRSTLQNKGFKWFGSSDTPHYDYTGPGANSHKGLDVLAFQRLWNRNNPGDEISEDGDYGPQTEARLKQAPAQGFAKGATCQQDGGGGGGASAACAHDPCAAGAALQASCDPCAQSVCAADAFCCQNEWDATCVGEVASVCGKSCGASASCGAFEGKADYTCAADGGSRGRCTGGSLEQETCANGCLLVASAPDVCMGSSSDWNGCGGSYSTQKVSDGDYYATNFGCWVDAQGNAHSDPGDNCIPGCLAKAQSSGLCGGLSGPECERHVGWYMADAGRFGCLARLRVTNPKNGKSVVLSALDYGPSCTVENNAGGAVADLSTPAILYLFGGEQGWADHAAVHVVEVDPSTPLGPA